MQYGENLFIRFASQLPEIFRGVMKNFIDAQGELILHKILKAFLNVNVERYSQLFYSNCLVLANIVGFVNGTFPKIARPEEKGTKQQRVKNGSKFIYALIFHAFTTLNGLCAYLFGPKV